jgi:membrane associated rhomboid family serine protease
MRFGPPITEWVKILIIVNVAVFIVQLLTRHSINQTFGLVPADAVAGLRVWQFVTHMFLHGDFWHIFFNMFMLWMFGSQMESDWGSDTFIRFYLFSGLGGGVLTWLTGPNSITPTIGASGAIFGILLAYALAYPNRQVLIWFLFPVKVKYLVIFLGALDLLAAFKYTSSGIAHFGHLGGLLFGFIYLRWFMRPAWARGTASGGFNWGPSAWRRAWHNWQAKRRMKVVDLEQKRDAERRREVNRILEKIRRVGVEGLSPEERQILKDESDRAGFDA